MERLAHTANHTRQQGGQRLSPGLAWPLTQLLAEGLLLPCPPLELSAWSIVATGAQGLQGGGAQWPRKPSSSDMSHLELETRCPLRRLRGLRAACRHPGHGVGLGMSGALQAVARKGP